MKIRRVTEVWVVYMAGNEFIGAAVDNEIIVDASRFKTTVEQVNELAQSTIRYSREEAKKEGKDLQTVKDLLDFIETRVMWWRMLTPHRSNTTHQIWVRNLIVVDQAAEWYNDMVPENLGSLDGLLRFLEGEADGLKRADL